MTNTYARMRQMIGSPANWQQNDIVLGDGEIALERTNSMTVKAKIGDGVSKYSMSPYLGDGVANIATYRGGANPVSGSPPAGAVSGDAYSSTVDGIVQASWGAPAAGMFVSQGDMLVKDDQGKWNVVPSALDPGTYVTKSELASANAVTPGSLMVGHSRPGGGGVTMSVAEELYSLMRNPREYGAKGDNVTNDRAAIQLCDSKGGGWALLPGPYVWTGTGELNADIIWCPGATIRVTTGSVLKINGAVQAGAWRMFIIEGTGKVDMYRAKIDFARPEWFGGFPSSGSVDAIAGLRQAFAAFSIVRLSRGSYYISDTLRLDKSSQRLLGVNSVFIGQVLPAEDAQASCSRLVIMSGSIPGLAIGASSFPGAINDLPREIVVEDVFVQPWVAPVISSNVSMVRVEFCLMARVTRVRSENGMFGFQIRGTVKTFINECFVQRSVAGTGPGTDRWIGFYVDGHADIGAAGGNASLFIDDCNCTGTPLVADCLGLGADYKFTDLFIRDVETVSCPTGILIVGIYEGGQPEGWNVAANTDCIIEHPIIDVFTDCGIMIQGVNGFGSIEILHPYLAPAATAAGHTITGIWIRDGGGRVVVRGGQCPAYHGSTEFVCARITNCAGAEIDGTLFLESKGQGVVLQNAHECIIKPRYTNNTNVLKEAVQFVDHPTIHDGCDGNIIEPFIMGSAGKVLIGIQTLNPIHDNNEFRVSGLRSSVLAGQPKLAINGTPITVAGMTGTNLASGNFT